MALAPGLCCVSAVWTVGSVGGEFEQVLACWPLTGSPPLRPPLTHLLLGDCREPLWGWAGVQGSHVIPYI